MSKERIVKYSAREISEKIAKGEDRTDWARVEALTDADIEHAMRGDPDWADHIDVNWDEAEIVTPSPKKAVSIRLDEDVVAFFKSYGKGYQTRINSVLRHFMTHETSSDNK